MADSLERAVAGLKRLPRRIAERAALRFDQIAKTTVAREVGKGGRIRYRDTRTGRFVSAQLATESHFVGGGLDIAQVEVEGTPPRPWLWLEKGTKPHWIGLRDPGDGPKSLAGPMLDHPLRGPVWHPGVVAARAWTEAANQLDREIEAIAADTIRGVA